MEKVTLEIPSSCDNCGASNVNIWGTRTHGKMQISIRCMRCGNKHVEESKENFGSTIELTTR